MRGNQVRTPGRLPAGRLRWLRAVGVAVALLSLACENGPVRRVEGRLEHSRHGYSIADPAVSPAQGAKWSPIELERAELAYTDGRGGSMMMLRECRGDAAPVLLARQLRIGIEGSSDSVTDAHPLELRGDAGWAQTFAVIEDGRELWLRSVTLSAELCTYDWVLVGAGDAGREASFDRWWSSFIRTGALRAAATGSGP